MQVGDDDFTLFGLPQQFSLDLAKLDTQWRGLQKEVHPDRFAAQGTASQRVAMQWAVRVNEAYKRLRDPLQRAAYLVKLRGGSIDAESNTRMPSDFLMSQMAWREALDEADEVAAVEALDAEVLADQNRRLLALGHLLDSGGSVADAAQQVRALMFVAKFREEVDRRLEAMGT
jgi:molecular chaperone HscB